MELPDTLCHLNGRTVALREAQVSVLDRGFIFGDGIYEVVPVYGRRLFRFEQHMARLDRSLDKVRIPNPHTRDQWLSLIRPRSLASPRLRAPRISSSTSRSRAAWPCAIT